ncbi:MAG: flagellar protein FlaG [Rhodoferax sp.]
MVSDVQSTNSVMRTPVVNQTATMVSASRSSAPDQPSSPKVVAPKPIDIRYDPAQAARNLQEAVRSLNQQLESTKTGLGFSIDKSLNTPVVIVTNAQTGEVVRKIPTEQVLQMAHSIDDMKGLLLNAKV